MGSKINQNGKLYKTEGRVTFVMSPTKGCPRINVVGKATRFRDDFGGRISSKSKLVRYFTSI